MTASVFEWLPKDVFTEAAIKSLLAESIARWSERWFARRPAQISAVQVAGGDLQLVKGLYAEGVIVDAELPGRGKRYLLEAMLDIDLSEQTLGEEDRQTLDALAAQAISDLVAAMDDLFDGEGIGEYSERIALSLSVAGNELLRLFFPDHVLVRLLKVQFGGPQSSDKQLRSRIEALRPVRLMAEGILGNADITLTDLRELAVGDVVILDRSVHEPVELRLSTGQLIGKGRLGQNSDRVSIQF